MKEVPPISLATGGIQEIHDIAERMARLIKTLNGGSFKNAFRASEAVNDAVQAHVKLIVLPELPKGDKY